MRTNGKHIGWTIIALVVNSSAWLLLESRFRNLWIENGPMENEQAACLFLCVGLFICAMRRAAHKAARIFFSALALLSATMLVLEVDFRQMSAPMLNKVMNGKIRDAWLGLLWVTALIFFLRNWSSVATLFFEWLRTPAGHIMIIAGACWIAGTLIDKGVFGLKDFFYEEFMECNGAVLMTLSAAYSLKAIAPPANDDSRENRAAASKVSP